MRSRPCSLCHLISHAVTLQAELLGIPEDYISDLRVRLTQGPSNRYMSIVWTSHKLVSWVHNFIFGDADEWSWDSSICDNLVPLDVKIADTSPWVELVISSSECVAGSMNLAPVKSTKECGGE